MSPASALIAGDYGGDALAQQTKDQSDELRRRKQAAQSANYSPAGVELSSTGILRL
jgi:hypothetical protein